MDAVRVISEFARTYSGLSAYPIMQTATTAEGATRDSDSAVLARHVKLIRYVARPFASRGVPLEDLMQEGSIALFGAMKTWRGDSALWTYARRLVLGAMFRCASRELDEPTCFGEGLEEPQTTSSEPDPEEAQELAECSAILADEVSKLTGLEQQVLRLRFSDELDIRSLATEIAVPRSTAQDILTYTLEKLRERVAARL